MAALNTFTPFDASLETWESYIKRFDCFLEANDLVDLTGSRRRATEEDADLPGDDNIHRLKTASGKYWQSTKIAQAQSCIGFKNAICQRCGKRGHLARKCRAILPDDRVQAKQGQ
ncbi:hypothetical protein E2320_007012, partial [Naja naja]